MQLTRFVRASELSSVLGVFSSVVGCGSGAQRGSPDEEKVAGKIRAEGHRAFHQQLKEAARAPDPRTGKSRAKSGS
jgi:hypothetical protein